MSTNNIRPWAKYSDEKTQEDLAASGEIREELDVMLEKRRAKKGTVRKYEDHMKIVVFDWSSLGSHIPSIQKSHKDWSVRAFLRVYSRVLSIAQTMGLLDLWDTFDSF